MTLGLGARLQLRQTQSLVMTPQLLQSIRLLQFTQHELDAFVDDAIEGNPLLDRAPGDEADANDADAAESIAEEPVDTWIGAAADASAERIARDLDLPAHAMPGDEPGQRQPAPTPHTDAAFDFADMASLRPDLRGHVREQIALSIKDASDRRIAEALAESLEDDGYMRAAPDDLAVALGVAPASVTRVLDLCQAFDPPGIFARDLSQCLALQLAARNRLDPAMAAMVANLDLVARRDFATLKRLCGVDEADLLDMLDELRRLDPKPGLAFSVDTADIVRPDVLVKTAPDGSWAIELNAQTLPKLVVDQVYAARVIAHSVDRRDRDFVSDCLQSANWLVRSLDQRARTILKVAVEIVRQQDGFLAHGVRHLRPLNLKQVAEAVGMHESTVSRVTANKFMMTPRGMFEFRYFFTVAIASADGGQAHSSEAVRDRIRAMIDAERVDSVLSDDAIVTLLVSDGVDIARRTVAKYREGMNIASSVQRRREKRALAAAGA